MPVDTECVEMKAREWRGAGCTDRQIRCMEMLTGGLTQKQVAAQLGITQQAVADCLARAGAHLHPSASTITHEISHFVAQDIEEVVQYPVADDVQEEIDSKTLWRRRTLGHGFNRVEPPPRKRRSNEDSP